VCPTPECQQNQTRGKLFPKTRFCKFVRFQSIKIQELPDQVPVGHTPRCVFVTIIYFVYIMTELLTLIDLMLLLLSFSMNDMFQLDDGEPPRGADATLEAG
jgi:hypothetical protein